MGGLSACWLRKTSRKLRSEPCGASESLLRSHTGLKTAARALREASRRPKSAPGCFKTAPRAFREAREGARALREASRRLTQASKLLKVDFIQEHLRALSGLLMKSQHQVYLDLGLNVTRSGRSKTHSKNQFDSAPLDSASFGSTVSVHVYARAHTSIYIYIYKYVLDAQWGAKVPHLARPWS